MDSTLSFHLQKTVVNKILLAGTAAAFKNMYFLCAAF